jgi:hypothetical protein
VTCSCGAGHPTYGACLRAKNLRIAYCQSARGHDKTAQDNTDRECNAYRRARSEGIQPGGTTTRAVEYAMSQSDRFGKAFDAGKPFDHLPEV